MSQPDKLGRLKQAQVILAILAITLVFVSLLLSFGSMVFHIRHPYLFMVSSVVLVLAGVLMLAELAVRCWHHVLTKQLEQDYQRSRAQADIARGSQLSKGKLP